MSLDVQSLLNSYSSLPQAPDVAGQAANAWSSIPSIHGVDLSNVAPVSVPFQVTAADFAKTPGLPSSAPSSAPSSSGGGGFWSGLWNHTLGPVFHDLHGALSSAEAPPTVDFSQHQSANPFSQIASMPIISGLLHPQQAIDRANAKNQQISQSIQNANLPDWAYHVLNMGNPIASKQFVESLNPGGENKALANTWNLGSAIATDPLTYTPVAPIARFLKVPEGLSVAKNAALNLPGAKPTANVLSSVFKPIAGSRQSFVDAVSRMHGSTQSGANQIMNQLETIFKDASPEQRVALTHAMESTAPGTVLSDPTLEALRQQVEPILAQSTQTALDRGLINGTIDPAEYGVGRYIPHVSTGKLDETAAPFADISLRKTGVDAGKSRGLQGTIQALNSGDKGKLFEDDMARILAYHLGQANKAVNIRDLIDHAMQNGIEAGGDVKAGDWFPNTVQKTVEYSHDGKTVLLPESEANFLKGLNVPTPTWKQIGGTAYRKTVNAFNKAMFVANPFIHIVNNLGTQTLTHDPGIFAKMPDNIKEAFTGIKPGSAMDDALKAGALHLTSEIGKTTSAKDMANSIVKSLDKVPASLSDSPLRWFGQKVASGWNKYNQLTSNMEKVYRSSAFQKGLEDGLTPEEAANRVRSMYGGNAAPGTASPFEKTMSTVMPFYNWTKTAIGSNLKNFAEHPLPYVAGFHTIDNYNRDVTGHGMLQNKNPLSIALPWKDKNGNQEYWTPYAPPFDVGKLAKDISQNGLVGGTGDFAFTRFNPVAKWLGQMLTHEQNPMAQPQNKFNVDPYPGNPLLPAQAHDRGILFGDKGYKAPPAVAQLLQDISNPVSDAMQIGSQSPRDAILSKLFGGAVSAPNPASQGKEQQYNMRQWLSQLKSYEKKQAQGGQ